MKTTVINKFKCISPKGDNRLLLMFSFLSVLCILFVFTKSSPLYPMNPWVDVNTELSMGRALLDGKMSYRDVYDHRGPILHLIFAAACFFSRKSYVGLYITEVISLTAFLYYNAKIAQLYLKKPLTVIQIIPLLAALIASSKEVVCGGSPEQLMLPFFSIPLFFIIRALKTNTCLKKHEALLSGIFAGIIFWIKYTNLGMYCGLVIFVIIWYVAFKKDITALAEVILYFLAGYAIVTLPLILYFALNGSLKFLFEVYFCDNIFQYGAEVNILCRLIGCYIKACLNSPFFLMVNLTSVVWLIFLNDKREKLLIALSYAFTFFTCNFLSFYSKYYSITLFVFSIFGFIWPVQMFLDYKKENKPVKRKIICYILALFLFTVVIVYITSFMFYFTDIFKHLAYLLINFALDLLLIAIYTVVVNKEKREKMCMTTCIFTIFLLSAIGFGINYNNTVLKTKREDIPYYKIVEYANKKENPKILYYDIMDIGIYNLLDQSPQVRYFYKPNVNDKNILLEMKKYVETKEADFVISSSLLKTTDIDIAGYKLIDKIRCETFVDDYNCDLYVYEKAQ